MAKYKDNSKAIFKQIKKLDNIVIGWGVSGKQNFKHMVWNEFGTKHIPERPAFRITFNSKDTKKALSKGAHKAIDQVLAGKPAKDAANAIGIKGLDALRRTFTSNIAPPNAESTIKKKGPGKNTLRDSGDLFRALGFAVVSKRGKRG